MRGKDVILGAMVLAGTCLPSAVLRGQQPVARGDVANEQTVLSELLARHITINIQHVSRKEAVDAVAKSAHVPVQYRVALLATYPGTITLQERETSLGIALERVLDGTPLRAVLDGPNRLMIVNAGDTTVSDSVQRGTVTGTVVDSATGRELASAVVQVQGTKIRAVTDQQGRFTLAKVPVGSRVVSAKLFGYHVQIRDVTVAADERAIVRMRLSVAANVLTGVITTAVGAQERRTIGNDITTIHVDSVMQTAPIRTVTDLLETRVPGLTVTHTSGIPGAPSRIRIRGIGGGLVPGATNNSNDPIVIVDGARIYANSSTARSQNAADASFTAPSPIDQIDPNSIETIDVLKGPSASAFYGPDAANGVIVITTKRGHAGSPEVRGNINAEMNYLPGQYAGPGYYPFGHNRTDGGRSRLCDVLGNGSYGSYFACAPDSLVVFQALNVPRLSMFGVGQSNGANVDIRAGTNTINYMLSAMTSSTIGYLRMPELYQDQYQRVYQQAVPSWMKRPDSYRIWSATANMSNAPVPGLQITLLSTLSTSDQRQSSAQADIRALSGQYIDTTALQLNSLAQFTEKVSTHMLTSIGSAMISWNRWTFFPVSGNVGWNLNEASDQATVPFGFLSPTSVKSSLDTLGYFSTGRLTTTTNTANLNGRLFPNARFATTMGLNFTQSSQQDFNGKGTQLSAGIAQPSALPVAGQVSSTVTTAGWFVEPRFNLNDRFYFAPGFRFDGGGAARANGNPTRGLWALLPKADFSWVAVDRQDQRPLGGFLTTLRPRLAFGVSSIQPDRSELLRLFSVASADTGSSANPYPGAQLTSIGNPYLRPERAREVETGFDAYLWGNRLTVLATTSYKLRVDAIVAAPVAPSAGSTSLQQYQNLGNVRNVTNELKITAVPVLNASTSWTVDAILSVTKNTLVKLNGTGAAIDLGDGSRYVAGYPLDGRWERPILGYTPPTGARRISAADVYLGDSVAYMGSAQPRYTLPVNSSLSLFHGMLNVNAGFQYEHGITQFGSGSAQLLTNLYLDPSTSLGQQAAVVAAYCAAPSSVCNSGGSYFGLIQTVNVLRFNTFTLNYNVPTTLRDRLRLPRTTVALEGKNLGLWTGYRGKDPDVNGSPVGETIVDNGQPPLPRSWGFRVTLGS